MTQMDDRVHEIRKDFPVLGRMIHEGKPLVYLDNAATSQKPMSVIQAVSDYYSGYNANVHRGIHQLSMEATMAYEEAHQKAADFIHAQGFEEIVFTKNATEAANVVAFGWGRRHIRKGDEIVLTQMEHHSNFVPWWWLAKENGAVRKFIEVDEEGRLRMDRVDKLITDKTKIVSVSGMSNVLGTINPVKEIGEVAHDHDAVFMVDGAQSVPHTPVDVGEMGCDFLMFSGHKMLGPTGIGVLYGRRDVLEETDPFIFGGEMIRRVTFEEVQFNDLPWRFEGGTPVIAQAIGLSAAIDYLNGIGMDWVARHERRLVRYAMERLGELPEMVIYGPPADQRGGVVSFNFGDIHAHDLSTLLDMEGVAVRAGHHCAQPLMDLLGIPATTRASFYIYNTMEEVDVLVKGLESAAEVFAG
jgi:cysteine desulfurase/selenocysteine lyase